MLLIRYSLYRTHKRKENIKTNILKAILTKAIQNIFKYSTKCLVYLSA